MSRGDLLGIKDESDVAVEDTRNSFLPGASSEFQKRILAMVCSSTVFEVSHGTYCLESRKRERDREQSAVDVRAAVPEAQAPPPTTWSSCQEEFTPGEQWNWRGTGTRTSVSGANMASLD